MAGKTKVERRLEAEYGFPIRDIVVQALNVTKSKMQACALLDLDRRDLYNIIAKYNIAETNLPKYK